MPGKLENKDQFGALSALVLVGQLGLVVVLPVAVGAVAGAWLDARAGIRGVFVIGLVLLGLAAGVAGAWQIVKREINRGDGSNH